MARSQISVAPAPYRQQPAARGRPCRAATSSTPVTASVRMLEPKEGHGPRRMPGLSRAAVRFLGGQGRGLRRDRDLAVPVPRRPDCRRNWRWPAIFSNSAFGLAGQPAGLVGAAQPVDPLGLRRSAGGISLMVARTIAPVVGAQRGAHLPLSALVGQRRDPGLRSTTRRASAVVALGRLQSDLAPRPLPLRSPACAPAVFRARLAAARGSSARDALDRQRRQFATVRALLPVGRPARPDSPAGSAGSPVERAWHRAASLAGSAAQRTLGAGRERSASNCRMGARPDIVGASGELSRINASSTERQASGGSSRVSHSSAHSSSAALSPPASRACWQRSR